MNLDEARKFGFVPDAFVCAGDVPQGRPTPWMIFEVMKMTCTFPPAAVIKVDDTPPGLVAGRNAGVWTVGVAQTGNELGLSEDEVLGLSEQEYESRLAQARTALEAAGAHFVINSVAEFQDILPQIEERLARGRMP